MTDRQPDGNHLIINGNFQAKETMNKRRACYDPKKLSTLNHLLSWIKTLIGSYAKQEHY